MRIIFSRKGFDSTAGGSPSPIFSDGTLFSIPIPSTKDDNFYFDLTFQYQGDSIQSILNEITGKRIIQNHQQIDCNFSLKQQRCHHDPMLIPHQSKLVLGQAQKAENHLRKQNVCQGDIFLFYSWFRQVEKINGHWQYLQSSRDIQLIWSWMKIGETLDIGTQNQREKALVKYPYLRAHPHFADWREPPNQVYISDEMGLLPYSISRCLTDCKEYQGRSTWRLPSFFNQPQAFTYLKNFIPDGVDVIINFRGYGQEFVLDLEKVSSEVDRTNILNYLEQKILS